jgi:hypothetical protein
MYYGAYLYYYNSSCYQMLQNANVPSSRCPLYPLYEYKNTQGTVVSAHTASGKLEIEVSGSTLNGLN